MNAFRHNRKPGTAPGFGAWSPLRSDLLQRRSQRGAYAIEFGLVFLLLFILAYGALTWALIFAAQQSLNMAAHDGARAALRYQSSLLLSDHQTEACHVARRGAAWLGRLGGFADGQPVLGCNASLSAGCGSPGPAAECTLSVTVSYDYQAAPLVPRLLLWPTRAGGNSDPTTPSTLSATSTARLHDHASLAPMEGK